MSRTNTLGLLTARLTAVGQRRLFEFFDAIDTDTAAQFRNWLGTAPVSELGEASDVLNRASDGREFAGWWRMRSAPIGSNPAQSDVPLIGLDPVDRRRRRAFSRSPNRSARNAGIPLIIGGYVLMAVARLTAAAGDAAAAFAVIIGLSGMLLSVGGCMKYAKEKGYSPLVGLVGLLSCAGLLILLLLPDRYRRMR
jgi:hypothetical protein